MMHMWANQPANTEQFAITTNGLRISTCWMTKAAYFTFRLFSPETNATIFRFTINIYNIFSSLLGLAFHQKSSQDLHSHCFKLLLVTVTHKPSFNCMFLCRCHPHSEVIKSKKQGAYFRSAGLWARGTVQQSAAHSQENLGEGWAELS